MPTSIVPPTAPSGRAASDDRSEDGDVSLGSTSPDSPSPAALRVAIAAHTTADSLCSLYAVSTELGIPAPVLADRVGAAGHRIHDGHILPTGLSVPQQLLALLTLAGTALTVAELVERLTPHKAESSVRNVLISDDRFVKADRTTWALARWGLEPYLPIHRQIANIVDERGGVGIDQLVAEIMQSYDVKEHSIRMYASTGDFMMQGNVVTKRTRKYVPRKSPSKTKYLYRDGSTIRWRTTIGPIHRKGSAFNLPSALAALLGVGPGAPQEFSSRLGSQSVIWVSVQARSGTIKRFVEDMRLTDGEEVFLRFEDGTFDIERIPAMASKPARNMIQRVGRAVPQRLSKTAALAAVADSLWLEPTSPPADIVETLRGRRETALADLVENLARPARR